MEESDIQNGQESQPQLDQSEVEVRSEPATSQQSVHKGLNRQQEANDANSRAEKHSAASKSDLQQSELDDVAQVDEKEPPKPRKSCMKDFGRQMTIEQLASTSPSPKIQRKLQFFGIEDKNPQETEDRIRSVLTNIKTRFGPMKNGMPNPDASRFGELMAIEASFGEPLLNLDQRNKNSSMWHMFYEGISHKKKFVKLKDCINTALEEKENEAKEQQLQVLKDLYSRKKKPIDGEDEDEETRKRVQEMVENEKRMKDTMRYKHIQTVIHSLAEQSDFDTSCLESFRNFIGYKYPILSPKRSSLERQRAGINDHAGAPAKVEARWEPGTLESMRETSKLNSSIKSKSRTLRKNPRMTSPIKLFNQHESLFQTSVPFDVTNDRPAWNQGPGGCIRHKRQHSQLNQIQSTLQSELHLMDRRQSAQKRLKEISRDSNNDLTNTGIIKPQPASSLAVTRPSDTEHSRAVDDLKWRRHLRENKVNTVQDMNQYADSIEKEMTLVAADRLEMLMVHLHDQMSALNELKASKGRQRRKGRRNGPANSAEVSASRSPAPATPNEQLNDVAEMPNSITDQTNQEKLYQTPNQNTVAPEPLKDVQERENMDCQAFETPMSVTTRVVDQQDPKIEQERQEKIRQSMETDPTFCQIKVDQNLNQEQAASVFSGKTKVIGDTETNYMRDSIEKSPAALQMEINQPNRERLYQTMPKSKTFAPFDVNARMGKQDSLLPSAQGEFEIEVRENVPATVDGSEVGSNINQSLTKRPVKEVTKDAQPVVAYEEPPPLVDPNQTRKEIKQQIRLTKTRIQTVFNILRAIKEDQLGTMDFEWAKVLQGVLSTNQDFSSILPTLMALKKLSRTPKDNNSLRNVLARKLYEIKQQYPCSKQPQLSESQDRRMGSELAQFYLTGADQSRFKNFSASLVDRERNNTSTGIYSNGEDVRSPQNGSSQDGQAINFNNNFAQRPPPTAPSGSRHATLGRNLPARECASGMNNRYEKSQKSRQGGSRATTRNVASMGQTQNLPLLQTRSQARPRRLKQSIEMQMQLKPKRSIKNRTVYHFFDQCQMLSKNKGQDSIKASARLSSMNKMTKASETSTRNF